MGWSAAPGSLRRMLRVVTEIARPAALDTALSAAILRRVASGEEPATLRVWTPDRSVAFGRQDAVRPGFRSAVEAVTARGFAPVERLAGGRAAVFHEGTLAFSWAMPEHRVRETITDRFRLVAGIVVSALTRLGHDARIGEVPGEYCPGEWSVNLGGSRKVMGVGQRLIRGGAHLGGVIVTSGAALVNEVLDPAYHHLGYRWDPAATGDLGGVSPGAVAAALLEAVAEAGFVPEPGIPTAETRELAARLAADHDAAR